MTANFSTYNNAEIDWTAPENPSFIVDGMSMNDIKQNGIGDCWFLASLASLAQRNERVSFVIQKQRNEAAEPEQGKITMKLSRFNHFVRLRFQILSHG